MTADKQPRLFIFWWDQGTPKCYDLGCGFVLKGPGLQPGTTLPTGSSLSLGWRHKHHKWWLTVDGQRSGYYPDDQWTAGFPAAGFMQVFGEVAVDQGFPVCDDMGNGKPAARSRAASVTDAAFAGGPSMALKLDIEDPDFGYTVKVTGQDSMRYGGPGLC